MDIGEKIKALVPIGLEPTLTANGVVHAAAVGIPSGNYILFVDPRVVDIEQLEEIAVPPGVEIEIIAVNVKPGQSIGDAVALYKSE